MIYLRLAWRNIWRNRRRTIITAVSIFIAVFLAVVMRSLQHGAYDNMIKNAAGTYVGYAQIHKKGYWNDKTLNNTFVPDSSLIQIVEKNEKVKSIVPRIESFALASSGNQTKPALVIGTNPEKEAAFSQLNKKIIKGAYFSKGEHSVLLAEGLAKNLNLTVKDTLVLLSKGFHGYMAAGKYPIKGILHFGAPALNKKAIYLPLKTAQQFYILGNRLTGLTLDLYHPGNAETVVTDLKQKVNPMQWEIMDWKTMMPQLVQAIELDNSGGVVMIGVLYLVIAFGVFGTILMMLSERKHEMGTLAAIGMKPLKMGWMIFSELILMIFLGIISGIAVALPLVLYLHNNPIRMSGKAAKAYQSFGLEPVYPFSTNPEIFVSQGAIILIIGTVLSLYAWYKILKLRAIDNMRG